MSPAAESNSEPPTAPAVDCVVVGAGFSGLYLLHALGRAGFSVRGLERADSVGGTWYYNRYPGARCDIESVLYSYTFDEELARDWDWSERYAGQPEILRYLEHVADRYDLRRRIRFGTTVLSVEFDEARGRWWVHTDTGADIDAHFVILAVGVLSATNLPAIPGLASFAGPVLHTGAWPHEGVDVAKLRVGVIGTGSTAIQLIPRLAEQAAELTVYQRTANYSVPAHNGPPDPARVAYVRDNHADLRLTLQTSSYGIDLPAPTRSALEVDDDERTRTYQARWDEGTLTGILQAYNDLVRNRESNATASDFIRSKIAELVTDAAVAEKLMPHGYPYGTKRPCMDTGYYATFNRPNVELVDLRSTPIQRIEPAGVVTVDSSGAEDRREHDVLVCATGFDAMTGPLLRLDVRGRGGRTLREAWADGPVTYLGLGLPGFPNLFPITGPGSPSALSNIIVSIEQHVEWITDLLVRMRERGVTVVDTDPAAAAEWTAHVQTMAGYTLYPHTDSWLVGANIPGKPRVFLPYIGGVGSYRARCDEVAADGYRGFMLDGPGSSDLIEETLATSAGR